MSRHATHHNKYPQIVEAEIDLHGCTVGEALERVYVFLDKSVDRGYILVRIITGKGLHAPAGSGVIRQAVIDFLMDEELDWHKAKEHEGGEGAIIVRLR